MTTLLRAFGTAAPYTFHMDSSTGNLGLGMPASTMVGDFLNVSGTIKATHLHVAGAITASGVPIERMIVVNSSSHTIDTSSMVLSVLMNSSGWGGGFAWVAHVDSSGAPDSMWAVAADPSGDVYCAGEQAGAVRVFDTSMNNIITAPDLVGSHLAKYDTSGTPQWVSLFSGSRPCRARDVAVDRLGNVLTVGTYGYHTTSGVSTLGVYDSSDVQAATLLSASALMVFVTKHNPAGELLWARAIDSKATVDPDSKVPQRVAVDASDNVLIAFTWQTGANGGPALFNASNEQLLTWPNLSGTYTRSVNLLKLSPSGEPRWAAAVGNDMAGSQGLAVDRSDGSIYVAGRCGASATDVYDASGTTVLPQLAALSTSGCFLAKFSASGTALWRLSMATGYEGGNVCVDGSGSVYLASVYDATAIGNLLLRNSSDATSITLPLHYALFPPSNNTSYCGFVAKYTANGTPQWATITKNTQNTPAMTLASRNEVIVTGTYKQSFTVQDPSGVFHWRSDTGSNIERGYAVRFGADGRVLAVTNVTNSSMSGFQACGVTVTTVGQGDREAVYVCGTRNMSVANQFINNSGTASTFLTNASGLGGYLLKSWETQWPDGYTLPALTEADTGTEKMVYNAHLARDTNCVCVDVSGGQNVTTIRPLHSARLLWLGTRWHVTAA